MHLHLSFIIFHEAFYSQNCSIKLAYVKVFIALIRSPSSTHWFACVSLSLADYLHYPDGGFEGQAGVFRARLPQPVHALVKTALPQHYIDQRLIWERLAFELILRLRVNQNIASFQLSMEKTVTCW